MKLNAARNLQWSYCFPLNAMSARIRARSSYAYASASETKQLFHAFIESAHGESCKSVISAWATNIASNRIRRLHVDLSDIGRFDAQFCTQLRNCPLSILGPWKDALFEKLEECVRSHVSHKTTLSIGKLLEHGTKPPTTRLCVGFVSSSQDDWVTPRDLRAASLGNLVCVHGIVTRCSTSSPKLIRSVHWCEETQQHVIREGRDSPVIDIFISMTETANYGETPTHASEANRLSMRQYVDAEGNHLDPEFGLATYKDCQTLFLQEPPEVIPPGQLPRSAFFRDIGIFTC